MINLNSRRRKKTLACLCCWRMQYGYGHCSPIADLVEQQLHVMVFNVHYRQRQRKRENLFAALIYFMTFRYRSIAAKTHMDADTLFVCLHVNTCHAFFSACFRQKKCLNYEQPLVIFFHVYFQVMRIVTTTTKKRQFSFFDALTIDAMRACSQFIL